MMALPIGDSFESRFSIRVGLGGADELVRLLAHRALDRDVRAEHDHVGGELALLDDAGLAQALLELRDLRLEHRLLVLRVVVLGVLGDVAELARLRDARGHLAAARRLSSSSSVFSFS